MRSAIVIKEARSNSAAYVPDLPGCVAAGATGTDVEREIAAVIAFHIEGLRADGDPVPQTTSGVEFVEVAA
jgi:predicted RNase H-like HicB family nuclease